MKEREVSETQINEAIEFPDRTRKEENNINIYIKAFGKKTLEVVVKVIKSKIIVITVYWS